MKLIGQKLKNGEIKIIEAPIPKIKDGEILVKCHYSIISTGTESSTLKTARKGYIGKAKERPQQAKMVIDTLKSQGPVQTYRAVMKKLDAYSTLGYSCSGKIMEIGNNAGHFKIGDWVACGGNTAFHSEYIAVPKNLCVKIGSKIDLKQAAYNTLGAIALQGVRQADLRVGENCAVIGLGLIGQITASILNASGVRTIGVDTNKNMVNIAKSNCLDLGIMRNSPGIIEACMNFTDGLGCDAIIITAASNSLDPINFAGAISKKRGKVIIVGAVPTGFDREPHYYKKELQVKMSCSYGPGRYDPFYEEKGMDYPAEYVRWTENRNMQAFQRLITERKIDLGYLTTHQYKFDSAANAYQMILENKETHLGILLEYEQNENDVGQSKKILIKKNKRKKLSAQKKVGIGFIGAGSYAMNHLIPNLQNHKNIHTIGVMTASGHSGISVAERVGFEYATTDENELISDKQIDAVFIATRHDTHFKYVIKALKNGKHVFVEKPLCLNYTQLDQIVEQLNHNSKNQKITNLMVGYNRRFSPAAKFIKGLKLSSPISVTYRINAGYIPGESWIQDKEIGGGRIIGEVCHFVDFITYMTDSKVKKVYALSMKDVNNTNDTVSITLGYENGSIGTINYFANGDKALPKELIEIYCNGWTLSINDFKDIVLYRDGKTIRKKALVQNKGQQGEMERFISKIIDPSQETIDINDIVNTSLVTFSIEKSLRNGKACLIDETIKD
jgi:polar amino acid transport system substrate-binding protein